jgi:hypothetical protein
LTQFEHTFYPRDTKPIMCTKIRDIDAARTIEIDANNVLNPHSVFIEGNGFCFEFDKGLFMHALAKEMGLGVEQARI